MLNAIIANLLLEKLINPQPGEKVVIYKDLTGTSKSMKLPTRPGQKHFSVSNEKHLRIKDVNGSSVTLSNDETVSDMLKKDFSNIERPRKRNTIPGEKVKQAG